MDNKRSAAIFVATLVLTAVALSSAADEKISLSCSVQCQLRCLGKGEQFSDCFEPCYIVCERLGHPPLRVSDPADYCSIGCTTASCLGHRPDSEEAKNCVVNCNDNCLEVRTGGKN